MGIKLDIHTEKLPKIGDELQHQSCITNMGIILICDDWPKKLYNVSMFNSLDILIY